MAGFTIKKKSIVMVFVIVLALTLNFIVALNHYSQTRKNAELVDALGRQRMLTQKIALLSEGVYDGRPDLKPALRESITMFDKTLYAFEFGGLIPGISEAEKIGPLPKQLLPLLTPVKEIWNPYSKNAEIILEYDFSSGIRSPEITEVLNSLLLDSGKLAEKNNDVVASYVAFDERQNVLAMTFVGVSIIISSLMILLLQLMINRSITKPLLELQRVAKSLEGRKFDDRANLRSDDEIAELGAAFNKAMASLENLEREQKGLERAKTEFLSISSHELRSPMTPMKAQAQMLLKGYFGKLGPKQKESLMIILKNTERLDKIVNDLLEVSRIEAARLKFSFTNEDVRKLILNSVAEMKTFMPERKIKLSTDIPHLPIIDIDSARFAQILRNLLSNAIKFSKSGGKVLVGAKLHETEIEIFVKDQGKGIKNENIPKLFEPFFQEEDVESREHLGSGLGLTISRGIVLAQHGRIWVESLEGIGTTVHFTIPLKPIKEMESVKDLF